jgi:hypothetical protein
MRTAPILFFSLCLLIEAPSIASAQSKEPRRTFRFSDVSLRSALDSLMRLFPVSIVYLDRDVEGKRAYASCSECGFVEALNGVLEGTSLTWIRIGNQVILKMRKVEPLPPVATLFGTVTDSITGERIANAMVLVREGTKESSDLVRRWCPTNPYGFYSLRNLLPGSYTIIARAVGYTPVEIPVEIPVSGPVTFDIGMKPEEITLQEITVEAYRTPLTSAGSFSRGIYIRSGPSDQSQYFLDGVRIYNPSHFGGVLSTFNDETLNDVQVMVEGMPPYYGGRIGGILDLSMRDGVMEGLSGSVGTGSLGSHLSLEGPMGNSTSFVLSGRRAYPDPQVPYLDADGKPSRLGSSEITAKLSHRLSASSRLFLSGYWGRDAYDNRVEGSGMMLSNNLGWGNSALNLRWIGIASPSLFLHASTSYSRYRFSVEHALTGDPLFMPAAPLVSDYAIEDVTVRAHAEHYYDEEHTVRGGVELVHHTMSGGISEFSSQISPMSISGSGTWELSVYLQDQWRILPRVTAELGARATNFTGRQASFSSVDPRFSLLVSLSDRARLYGTLTSINQFVHPYRSSGVFLFYPTIFWYPSTDRIKPSTSIQMTVGLEKTSEEDTYAFSLESFYRITHNLHEFMADSLGPVSSDLSQNVFFGTGKLYGVEVNLRKRTGNLTGSVSYTYSWEQSSFPELNGGRPFVPRFSRRHELRADAWFSRGGWSIGALCVLALTQSWPHDSDGALAPALADGGFGPGRSESALSLPLFDLSQSRFPGFQRLELKVLRSVSFWGTSGEISLRMLNAYGLLDPFAWKLHNHPDMRLKWTARVQQLRLFPLYPTLGVAVRF